MSITPNAVINGDCLEVMKEIDAESIDLILCDLPYGATQNSRACAEDDRPDPDDPRDWNTCPVCNGSGMTKHESEHK